MTAVTSPADAFREKPLVRIGVLRQMRASRADYLYVLPAIVVMPIVIA